MRLRNFRFYSGVLSQLSLLLIILYVRYYGPLLSCTGVNVKAGDTILYGAPWFKSRLRVT